MSDELKRRLVGVIVLLAVFSLIAWWVGTRNGQPAEAPSADADIRNYDVRELESIAAAQRAPQAIPEPTAEAAQPAASPEEGAATEAQEAPAPEKEAQPEQVQKTPAPEPAPAPVAKADPKPVPEASPPPQPKAEPRAEPAATQNAVTSDKGNWIVQVASVTNKANAERLASDLGKQGWKSFVEAGMVDGTTYYRVRVGPYVNRGDADGAAQKLQENRSNKVVVMAR